MSFDTATSWPPGLLTIFDHCRNRPTAFGNRYYGPFDKLLNYCFGSSFDFYVAPQNPPMELSGDSIVFLVVRDRNDKPVLLVEIKDDGWAQKAELRYRADIQMRERYALMLDECPLPQLWGISVLGTSMRVYRGDTATYDVVPPAVPRPQPQTRMLSPSYLADRWDLDILSVEGFNKMKEIVNDILAHRGNIVG